ncbi:MAG: ABC-F family ATP-binding cassette domain-containing protein [Mobiluncus porci]|uniref:ABC-F family ATP-binding cassette domain-containing protein n=1 Tax=Mobiluncus porci TaxID=2652278 RepID=UPI0023F1B1F5|nr:ABC-F family ATP-binding cassette domain-containing protein [Mobiluncus porci]MDD7542336.1 ABC-F family ATP-binding cassette domain-containing protein [Mobiluncus porci]MDY5749135.1 ABC-F family ATP-binding cassette domain-containing protein [Mobiluncus porci]
MITATGLTLRIADRVLLHDASFQVNKGMRIGLVGRNGAGKTTLMRLLSGTGLPDAIQVEGSVSRTSTPGYLPQDPGEVDPDQIVRDHILSVRGLDKIEARIRKAEMAMSAETGEKQQKAMEKYVRLDQEFHVSGGYAAASEAAQIAANLGIGNKTMAQKLGTLSGGQRRRVELARVLFSGADTLLLDEPTNHLDHDSIMWLRGFLRSFSGGFLVISHNVKLLDETVNQVMFLDALRGQVDTYHLGWKAYLKARAEDEARRKRERAVAEKKAASLREQGERLHAKATKAVAAQQMLRRAEALLENTQAEGPREKVAKLAFPKPAPCGKVPLTAEGLSKSYGSLEVFTDLSLAVDRGAKVVVLGFNGAGKTTLLRLLAGLEEPDTGEVIAGHGLKLGYYAQEHETLDNALTVVENLQAVAPGLNDTELRSLLGQFLFSGSDADKPTGVLSGGEKTRLALATLVMSGANVLLLDEPTNNLDPASREEILKSLASYEGAVVLVTHDPGAVQALSPERVLLLPDGDEDLWDDDEYLELVEAD